MISAITHAPFIHADLDQCHELLVGSAVQTLILSMAVLPEYATQEEVKIAAKRFIDLVNRKLEKPRECDAKREEEAWYESVIVSLEGWCKVRVSRTTPRCKSGILYDAGAR